MAITKDELARRLKISPTELVTRPEAAAIISRGSKSLSAETLRVRPKKEFPGYYNLSDSERSGEVLYRRDWLLAFKAWRDGKFRGPRPSIAWGRQDCPDPPGEGEHDAEGTECGLSPAELALMQEFFDKCPRVILRDEEVVPVTREMGQLGDDEVVFTIVDTSSLSPAEKGIFEEFHGKLESESQSTAGEATELVLWVEGQFEFTKEIVSQLNLLKLAALLQIERLKSAA